MTEAPPRSTTPPSLLPPAPSPTPPPSLVPPTLVPPALPLAHAPPPNDGGNDGLMTRRTAVTSRAGVPSAKGLAPPLAATPFTARRSTRANGVGVGSTSATGSPPRNTRRVVGDAKRATPPSADDEDAADPPTTRGPSVHTILDGTTPERRLGLDTAARSFPTVSSTVGELPELPPAAAVTPKGPARSITRVTCAGTGSTKVACCS
mmetsp:Transcript_38664/g.95986  ORF Transcript_38664/g.95986 Transcript_38664/m.95986 type:complete len:206 (-) Transcript_38664:364-981(-)